MTKVFKWIDSQERAFIDVFSCGIDFDETLSAKNFLTYDIIFGSASLLKTYAANHPQSFPIAKHAKDDAKNALEFAKQNKKVAVLCSGDALYHGFGSTLLKFAKQDNCEHLLKFYPNITAFQALFHRIGLEWNEAKLFSLHHNIQGEQGKKALLPEIIDCDLPVIYGGSDYPSHVLAKCICECDQKQSERYAIMAEYLGSLNKERILQAKLIDLIQFEFSPTSILILLPMDFGKHKHLNWQEINENTANGLKQSDFIKKSYPINKANPIDKATKELPSILPLGLPEDFYCKENNLITASDARAIILARLKLPNSGVFWDLGAGSGSVGLECAALQANLNVFAVEQKESRLPMILQNRQKLNLNNYKLEHGDILEKIANLPSPDRVFIGGGGKDIVEILEACASKLNQDAIMLVSAVTLESFHKIYNWQNNDFVQKTACLQINIAKEEVLAGNYHSFQAQNTLYLFIYKK